MQPINLRHCLVSFVNIYFFLPKKRSACNIAEIAPIAVSLVVLQTLSEILRCYLMVMVHSGDCLSLNAV